MDELDDDGGLHVRTFFLHEAPQRPYNVTAGFVLNQGRLFTLRDEALVRASGSTSGRWSFGYPLAFVLMVASGCAPYWCFKRRAWL